MSRPPLVVMTRDQTTWTRRAATYEGLALYAPEGVCSCPEFVMATLAELAEHGITGTADVLPVPVGASAEAPMTAQAASIRLAQYGAGTRKTWSTATYDSGAEKALHEIALTLDAEVVRLRARVAVLEARALPDFGEHLARLATPEGRAAAEERVMAALAAPAGPVVTTPQSALDVPADCAEGAEVTS